MRSPKSVSARDSPSNKLHSLITATSPSQFGHRQYPESRAAIRLESLEITLSMLTSYIPRAEHQVQADKSRRLSS